MLGCKLLKGLVPGAGFEPAPSYEERILSLLPGYSQHSTTRYQVVFTDVSAVKASLRLAWYEHVSPSSAPHPATELKDPAQKVEQRKYARW